MIAKYILLAAGLGLALTITAGCAGPKAESKTEKEKTQIQRDKNLDAGVDSILDE